MRTTRIAVLTLASLAACSSAQAQQPETCAKQSKECAQQSEECAKKAEECARQAEVCAQKAQEEARAVAKQSRRHHAARAYAEQDRAQKMQIEAEMQAVHAHAREAQERAEVEAKYAEENAEQVQGHACQAERARKDAECQAEQIRAALAAAGQFETLDAEKLQAEIAEALGSQDDLQLHLEALAELQNGANDGQLLLAQHLLALPQGGGASTRLEQRVRALEERLGVSHEDEEKTLEERVAELERRTMPGGDRRMRMPGESDAQRDMAIDRGAHLRALSRPRVVAVPRSPGSVGGVPGVTHGWHPIPGLAPVAPTPPGEIPPVDEGVEMTPPAPPDEAVPIFEEPSELPEMRVFTRTTPSAPRRVRSMSTSGLTAERRKEVEEVMERMRTQMERLREEMNRLRSELGRNGNLRGLGYVDEDEDSEDE